MRKELIAHDDPKSPISEIFRTLRTNIQFMNTKKKLKTIIVTSTSAGEGKSFVSSNLAVTFAQTGKRVLLVDADMRKGRQYKIFKLPPKPGLSDYLSGIDFANEEEYDDSLANYIKITDTMNLYVMVAGSIPPNPAELLISSKMTSFLEEVKQLFDFIIIDSTPCQLVADALILSRIVDATIVVSACNQTKKEDLNRVLTGIQNVGGNISGVVINKLPVSAKKYRESYYYKSSGIDEKTQKVKPISHNKEFDINDLKKNIEGLNVEKENIENRQIDQALEPEKRENDTLKQINDYLDQMLKK